MKYHGTDTDSAHDIAENGLNKRKWMEYVQEGGDPTGFSLTEDISVARQHAEKSALFGRTKMGSLICNYPEHSEPLTRLEQLKLFLQPFIVRADGRDVYSQSTAKVENALAAADRDKSHFVPLVSMKRNAAQYGPQYKFTIEDIGEVRATGAINRRILSVVWNDPIPCDLLSRLVAFAKTIDGVMIEIEDDEGNSLLEEGEQEDPIQQDGRKKDARAGKIDV